MPSIRLLLLRRNFRIAKKRVSHGSLADIAEGVLLMTQAKRQCPNCQLPLKVVHLSDLIGEVGNQRVDELIPMPAAGAVFEYFDFYVCGQCGRTLIYAGSEAQRVAAEGRRKRSGGVLNLE